MAGIQVDTGGTGALAFHVVRIAKREADTDSQEDLSRIPSLENGDNLSSHEFLRRFEGMPQLKKAELIEGVVYMGSPVSREHSLYDGLIQAWMRIYKARTPGVEHLTNTTLLLDPENTLQPDSLLRLLPEKGGKTWIEGKYLAGPPELVAEIAVSSASIDLRDKFRACQRNGVREYLVCLARERQIRWFSLKEQRYVEQEPSEEGFLSSTIFPGLVLNVNAFLSLDDAGVLKTLEAGVQSEAHGRFVGQGGS